MSVQLGPGHYAFRCAIEDEPVVTGPTVSVAGPAISAPAGVLPVTEQDLLPATRAYERYVSDRLPMLLRGVQRLRADVAAGNRGAAERDWLTAHLEYERLGAAYGAFGDADSEINGGANGRPKGVRDKGFTGFHRIEYGLWHDQPMTAVRGPSGALVRAVTHLRAAFPTAQIDPLDVSIRAHEITENALEFELTGRTDYGSHSSLATVAANLDGTRTVLGMITPLLRRQIPGSGPDRRRAHPGPGRPGRRGPPRSLDGAGRAASAARERIDSDISQLTEQLAPIAQILEPRRAT